MDKFAEAGIAWWNSIDDRARAYWLEMAKSAAPVDAYKAWLQYRADVEAGKYGY